MKIYFVCVLLESSNADQLRMVEERILHIHASNPQQAELKAAQFTLSTLQEYVNEDEETVEWRFVRVVDVQQFCELELNDGVEVYSRMEFLDADP